MMLEAILWAIFGLLFLAMFVALAIICTPVQFSASFNTEKKPILNFKTAIFGGLCPVFSTTGARKTNAVVKKKEKTERAPKKTQGKHVFYYGPPMARAIPRLVSRLAAQVKFDVVSANIAFGLPDPADTGVVYGALQPVALLASAAKPCHVIIQPDFSGASFGGHGILIARFTPIALVPPVLRFGWAAFVSPKFSGAFR